VNRARTTAAVSLVSFAVVSLLAVAVPAAADAPQGSTATTGTAPRPDLSGRKRVGVASFYAQRFAGRTMADGQRMDPNGANAASRTLPLGTVARVTNLESGRSAIVRIQDRGPYVGGRIVDLSPATAREIGLSHEQGLATVEVAPLVVPMPDGGVRYGEAARDRGSRAAETG
jgi:rare lipoprotein A